MNPGQLVRIYSHEALDPDHPDDKEPCMNICRRAFGRGRRVVIPLRNAYQYVETGDLIAKAAQFAAVLYDGVFNRSQVVNICNVIDDGLYDLLTQKPHEGRSAADLENEMDRLGLVLTVNGEAVIDATH